jgi:dihydrofolate reductase
MGKIIVTENVSLDGVVQDPTGEEGLGRGGWGMQLGAADRDAWVSILADEAQHSEALLMGRRTDEWFAARWLTRTGPWAERLNSMPKYVVSSNPDRAKWSNATVLTGDIVSTVSKLKDDHDGEIVVYGSGQLVHTLTEHDLVDELRLLVFPVVLGAGDRLFPQMTSASPVRRTSIQAIGDSLALLRYERVPTS